MIMWGSDSIHAAAHCQYKCIITVLLLRNRNFNYNQETLWKVRVNETTQNDLEILRF